MRLSQACRITDIRKRKVMRMLPDNEMGKGLGEKIIAAMYHHKDSRLSAEELEFFSGLTSTPYTDKVFKEEIEKERNFAKKT